MNSTDPKDRKTKFCIYCGKKIPTNAKKCSYCFEWLDDEFSSEDHGSDVNNSVDKIGENKTSPDSYLKNQNFNKKPRETNPHYKNTEEYSKVIPIRRFYLLMIITFGLYSIYWFYKNSSYLRDEFGKDINVGLRTFAFALIPVANIIVFYELLNDMKKLIEEKGLESYSSGLNTCILLFFSLFGGGFLVIWVYINVQEYFNDFWRIHESSLPIRRKFNNGEILVMILMPIIVFILILLILVIVYIQNYPY